MTLNWKWNVCKESKSGNTAQREYKAVKFQLESADDESGEFSGYAAIFSNVDDGDDIIEKGAFIRTIQDDFSRIKILSQHDSFELPIGKPLELREDDKGLYIRGKISNTQKGRDILTLIRDGVLNELSIGYDTVDSYLDISGIRHLKEVKLWEVSVVTWAMNKLACINNVKSVDDTGVFGSSESKISRAKLNSLNPFIAAVRELAEILSPYLEVTNTQSTSQAESDPKKKQPEADTDSEPESMSEPKKNNPAQPKTKKTKMSGVTFEIVRRTK